MVAQNFRPFVLAALLKNTRMKRLFPMARFFVNSGRTIKPAITTASESGGRAARHWARHFDEQQRKHRSIDVASSSNKGLPEAPRLFDATLSFLQNDDSVDAAWQIM
jgi:hypothetical protein